MERRSGEEDNIRAYKEVPLHRLPDDRLKWKRTGIILANSAIVTSRFRAGHASFDCDAVA
jgi:hypothetical protein